MSSTSSSSSGSGSGSSSGEESKSKSGSVSRSKSQDGSQYSSQSGSKSQSGSQYSSQSGSKSQSGSQISSSSKPKSQDNSYKSSTPSRIKSKEEVKQEKMHIFDRIAAGENVNGSFIGSTTPPSKAAQAKDGNQTHGHVLRAGHYRYSPGFQQVRHGYRKKQEESGAKIDQDLSFLKATSVKATSQAKKITSDEAIHKSLKSGEHSTASKRSENPFFGTLSAKPKVTSSDRSLKKVLSSESKSSIKQQPTSKSNDDAKSSDDKSHH